MPPLCYSFLPHGDTPSEPKPRVRTCIALLPELCGGGQRSADLRRLLLGDLSPLRDGAGIVRRIGHRIMESPSAPPATETSADNSKPTLVRGLGLLDSVLLLVSGIIGSSIFLTAKDIAGPLPQPILFLLVWVLGALLLPCAFFAFAELCS